MTLLEEKDKELIKEVDMVNHPPHYNTGKIEVIVYIEDKSLGYHLGNAVKYISRAPHKHDELEDLKKAQWYLKRRIANLEQAIQERLDHEKSLIHP